jgi:superfamily II DNA or RNA helicase
MSLTFTEDYRTWGNITIADDQVDGINFLLSHSGCVLSFGTGMGKTLTGCVASKIILDNYPNARTVIVHPVKAQKAFRKTLFKTLGYKKSEVGIISTEIMDFDINTNKIFLITDTNIEKYSEIVVELAAKGYKIHLMIDEAHKLQDKDSKFYKTMSEVKSICTICHGLSATPILNDLDSLYTIVNFFCPGFLGKKGDFNNRYTVYHLEDQYIKGGRKIKVRVIDSYQNLDELNKRLKSVIMVRQIQYDLKFGNLIEDMTQEEYDIYETVSSGMLGDGEERNFSRRMHDLQRFIDRSYDEDESLKDLVQRYNATQYSTKEMLLLKALKKTLAQGFSCIIYADYHATIDRLHKVLLSRRLELGLNNIFEITGNIDIATREMVEEKIGQKDVVLITSAGSESINLQRANCIILYDIPFSVKTIIQVVGRICRRDTLHKHQYILTLVMKGTIDEYKYKMFQSNLAMVQQSTSVATDLPLEYIGADIKSQDQLKNELLWHYRSNSLIKKQHRKDKKQVKSNLLVASIDDASNLMATNKFLIEPISNSNPEIKEVPSLYPNQELYERYRRGEIPFTKIRADYLRSLRSEEGRKLIKSLQSGVLKHGTLALIGQTKEFPEVLKQEVLDQFVI